MKTTNMALILGQALEQRELYRAEGWARSPWVGGVPDKSLGLSCTHIWGDFKIFTKEWLL